MLRRHLTLLALALATSCASSRAPAEASAPPPAAPPAPRRTIPESELTEAVCEGRAGAAALERAKLRIYLADEVRRRAAEGRPAPELPADLEAALHALFLPEDPAEFPPATVEAMLEQPGGEAVLEHYRMRFETPSRTPTEAEGEFDAAVLQQILAYLDATAVIEAHPAQGVLRRVNGTDILTGELWAELAPDVSEADRREAERWLTKSALLRTAFERTGAWLSDEEAEAAYHAHSDPYAESVFSQERIALEIKGFPSVERYREYRRFYESFLRWKEAEMDADALERHARFRTDPLIGMVSVDVDVLLCSAYDFASGRWKPDGWAEAERRMREAVARLDGGASWDELLDTCSDFPSEPVNDRDEPVEHGRFRGFQRNNLMPLLGESEYSLFLEGHSLADSIVFQQEVGTRGAPVRGPFGWYLPRLLRRTEPVRPTLDEDTRRELILDDYVTWHLDAYAEELASAAR